MALTCEQIVHLKAGQMVKTAHLPSPGRISRIYVPADGQRAVWIDYGPCIVVVAPSQITEVVR